MNGIQTAAIIYEKVVSKAHHLDDDSTHLHSTYYMPGTVQNTLNNYPVRWVLFIIPMFDKDAQDDG